MVRGCIDSQGWIWYALVDDCAVEHGKNSEGQCGVESIGYTQRQFLLTAKAMRVRNGWIPKGINTCQSIICKEEKRHKPDGGKAIFSWMVELTWWVQVNQVFFWPQEGLWWRDQPWSSCLQSCSRDPQQERVELARAAHDCPGTTVES